MGDICKLGLHVLLKFWLGVSMLIRLELLLPKVPLWFSHCCVNSRKLNQRAENVSLACFKLTLPSVPRMPEFASSATPYPRLYWFVHILSATFIHTESICWMKYFFLTPDAFYDQNPEISKSHSYGYNIKMSHPKTKREPEQGTSLAWQLTNGSQELIPTSARTDYIWPLYTTPAKGYLETNHCRIWQSLGCKTSLPCGLPFHGLNTRKWGLFFRVVSVW